MIKVTKKGSKAWVTFNVTPNEGEVVSLCGEWNDWKNKPMKVKKSGDVWITEILPLGKSYQFGYRVNENEWRCDDTLECVQSPFGSQNSLLKL